MRLPLSALATYANGYPFKPDELGDIGTPVVRIRQLVDPSAEIDRHAGRLPDRFVIDDGDLIFSWSGSLAVRLWDRGRGYLNQHLFRVDPVLGIDRRWLGRVLEASLPRLDGLMHGSAMTHITKPMLKLVNWDVPSHEEQRRIADFLDDRVARIDQIIIARRTQMAAVESRFAAIRRRAVLGLSGPTRSTGLPWAEHMGANWRVRRLSQIAHMGTGHTPSRNEPAYWVDCDIPWLTTSDVHRFRHDEIDRLAATEVQINAAGLANSAAVLHPAGTVALSRTASAGFSIIMDVDMATSQDFVTWTCGEDLRPEFLLHSLRVMRPYLLGYLSMGSTHKTIYFPDLMDLRAPVPPVALQMEAIGEVQAAASERHSLSVALDRQIVLMGEYKQSLIAAAVTGELDVTTAGSGVPG